MEPKMKKLSEDELRAILSRKLDFSQVKMDRDVLESFIKRIVPLSHTEFRWDMNFLPRKEGVWDEYQCVWTFQIGFDEAREYKKLNKGMLRQSQWQDLTIHVYM